MAVTPKDEDRQSKHFIAEVTLWQEMSYQLVEPPRDTSVAHLQNENWRLRAQMVRRHAAEHTDPDTKRALLELAESYDLLAQRDAQSKNGRQ
jgi:hypothetical protein